MTINLTLNQEQTDALNTNVAEVNATRAAATPPQDALTAESFLSTCLESAVNGWVREAYDNAVKQLGVDAKKLDYATRKALIQQVKQATGQ